jgi:hypothetical protein
MEKPQAFTDVEAAMKRLMINLYKRKIREEGCNPHNLNGNWSEVSDILRGHFGKVTRVAEQNSQKLVGLYRIAVDELKREPI